MLLLSLLFACGADPAGPCVQYPDGDGDGLGDAALPVQLCEPSPGYVLTPGDCDDDDPTLTVITAWADEDMDGFGDPTRRFSSCVLPPTQATRAEDCDDGNAATNPEAVEVCDDEDNDCDAAVPRRRRRRIRRRDGAGVGL
jgi:hypothetical protein